MEPLKIYFLPYLAMGHMIPMVHVARLVAARGEHVTIMTTPLNAKAFTKQIDHDRIKLGHNIQIHIINFPSKEVGLPEGLENVSSATNNDSAAKICAAAYLLQSQVEAFVETNPPHVIVTDMMLTWSRNLTIPRLVFNSSSIFVSSVTLAINTYLDPVPDPDPKFVIPGLPHPITLSVKPSHGYLRLFQNAIEAEENSLGVILNSFCELESEYAKHYEKVSGRKVWHVGPALPTLNNDTEEKIECLDWLNEQQNDSVVYICFGSVCRFTDDQLLEIACGIEASGHKFLWVVHRKAGDDDDENTWLPRGFKERTRGKGVVVGGWVPQVKILNHKAIGGFLSHCGLTSVVEAVSAGVPMITMPAFGDQYYMERLITEVCGFGVEVGGQEWMVSPYDVRNKVVARDRIAEAVKRVMDGGDEALRVRKRANELKQKAHEAVQDGGSSHANLTELIQEIKQLVFK